MSGIRYADGDAKFHNKSEVIETLILNHLTAGAKKGVGAQVLHDMEVRSIADALRDALFIELRTTIYAHRVEEVTADDTVTWRVPRRRVDHLRFALRGNGVRAALAAALLTGIALIASSSALALGVVLCVAAVALIAVELAPTQFVTHERRLVATVDRWATFPDNSHVYPSNLGDRVPVQMLRTVTTEATDDSDYDDYDWEDEL